MQKTKVEVEKVTVSRTLDGNFVCFSCGISGPNGESVSLEDAADQTLTIGYAIDKVLMERCFLSRSLSQDLLVAGLKAINQLHKRYLGKRDQILKAILSTPEE